MVVMNIRGGDHPSPNASITNIRDFANNTLFEAARTLGAGHDWFSVDAHYNVNTSDGATKQFFFEADQDEFGAFDYRIKLEEVNPFNNDWLLEAAMAHVGVSFIDEDDGDIELADDYDDNPTIGDIGFFGEETEYIFSVGNNQEHKAAKLRVINFYDEDYDLTNTEIVSMPDLINPTDFNSAEERYSWGIHNQEDNLFKIEAGLAAVTLSDLDIIASALRRHGLIHPQKR